MPHYLTWEKLDYESVWLTIGSFDGVHLGHQHLIKKMADEAHAAGSKAVVLTFFPHPLLVLKGSTAPYYLTDSNEKADLLIQSGADAVLTVPFTKDLASLSALEFIQKVKTYLNLSHLWVGYDFALGRNREGDIPRLTEIGKDLGFQVSVFQPFLEGKDTVSSRQIRALLTEGKVDLAAKMLGRYYSISGEIVHGDGRGHLIGIPTTNLQYSPQRILPRPGVYATYAHVGDRVFKGVSNIGTNPTFINAPIPLRLETYILDFSGDLYGTRQTIDFCYFIRPEEKYDSIQALKDRIQMDIQFARENLK
ncbi:MAG: bifunctional riboflavin kinase/FAD synthetase [Anaerolineae bacterium]|nr:bifunctional riboflavin kinase/FAD synthetase [Anaerolineae bacterium]